jgi:PPPDE putative peptidase domain
MHSALRIYDNYYEFGVYYENGKIIGAKKSQDTLHKRNITYEVLLGNTDLTESKIDAIFNKLLPKYGPYDYDFIRHNCNVFCYDFAESISPDLLLHFPDNIKYQLKKLGLFDLDRHFWQELHKKIQN